jgi:hypothetical protein
MLKLDVLAAELNLWANETEQIYRATKEIKYRGDAKHLRYLAATLNQSSLPSTGVTSFNTRVGDVVLSSLDVTTALGYNPVTQARTLTINGVTYDLSANRSWTISTATPTLAQVTTAGNTTTNAITVGGLTANNKVYLGSNTPHSNDATNIVTVNGIMSLSNGYIRIDGQNKIQMSTSSWTWDTAILPTAKGFQGYSILDFTLRTGSTSYNLDLGLAGQTNLRVANTTGNILINTTTDAGYKLDVNGTARVQGDLSVPTGKITFQTSAFGIDCNTSTGVFNIKNNLGSLQSTRISFSQGTYLNIYQPTQSSTGITSGILNTISTPITYAWSSGTAQSNLFVLNPTINNTGTYSAIFRGFWYNPTLTSLTGTTHRAIETTSGDVLLATTSGNVAIGTSTLGTATELTLGGSQTASSAIARGQLLNTTLVAAANNDVLVGLDINPTFTNGAFTGVDNWDLRTRGKVLVSSTSTGNVFPLVVRSTNYPGILLQNGSTGTNHSAAPYDGFAFWINYDVSHAKGLITNYENNGISIYNGTNPATGVTIFGSTNNVAINSTTDAGYKLDVNGTARVQTSLEIGSMAGVTFGGGATALSWAGGGQLSIGNSATWTNIRFYTGLVEKYTQTTTLTTITNTTINLATNTVQLAGINALTYSGTDIRIGSVAAYFNSLSLYVAGSEKARIDSSGNFGLGTSTPTDKFHIVDNTNGNKFARISAGGTDASAAWVAQNDQVDNVVYRVFGSAVTGTQFGQALARSASLMVNLGGTGKFLIGSYSSTDLIFGTSDQARMRLVDSTGNFLIGTMTDTGNKLTVSGNIDAQGYKVNNVLGFTGIFNVPTNPPGSQNLDIQGGIIVNVF